MPNSFGKESGSFSRVSMCWCRNVDTTISLVESHECKVNWASEESPTLGCSIEISRDSASEAKLTNRRENCFKFKKKSIKKSIV